MIELDLCRRGIKRNKPKNHDGIGSNRREKKGDKPGNHDGIGSSRRETKEDKPRNHVGTKYFFFCKNQEPHQLKLFKKQIETNLEKGDKWK